MRAIRNKQRQISKLCYFCLCLFCLNVMFNNWLHPVAEFETISSKGTLLRYNCSNRQRVTYSEDLLCKKPKKFLSNFKNPCWLQEPEKKLLCLPYFHIFGVCKSGTTDLFNRIVQHPQILKNKGIIGKETWFWSWRRYGHGLRYMMPGGTMYLSQFAKLFDAEAIGKMKYSLFFKWLPYSDLITGHGDPLDFWENSYWPRIPQNDPEGDEPNVTTPHLIRHVNPNVKLILMLRDPIERVYSHYLHSGHGSSSEQFHKDALHSVTLLDKCKTFRSLRACLYDRQMIEKLKVPLYASIYDVHLQEWLNVFSRQQMLILMTEEYKTNTSLAMQTVFEFLNVDPVSTKELQDIASLPVLHQTTAKKLAGDMLPKTRDLLRKYFRESVINVAQILQDAKYLNWA